MNQPVDFIKIIKQAFKGISEEEARTLISSGEFRSFPVDHIICQEGALEYTFYIMLEGEVSVTQKIGPDQDRLITNLGPGTFFGEMALINEAPRAATITALEETLVLEIPRAAFNAMIESSRTMSMALTREVSRRLRENDLLTIQDLTIKNQQLSKAYADLANLEKARSEFLTVIAHELRTPLMAANGYLQLVQSGGVSGGALTAAIDTITRNLHQITSLTNDILFIHEMNLILSEFQPTQIRNTLQKVIKDLEKKAEENKVELHLEVWDDIKPILADEASLYRAFHAVVDNAIKFSPNGGDVNIRVFDSEDYIQVIIQDNGVGIPKEAVPRIFERFFHIDELNNQLFRGAGLGLSIAKQVIEQHQGTIEASSELEQGSTFTITLPKRPIQSP